MRGRRSSREYVLENLLGPPIPTEGHLSEGSVGPRPALTKGTSSALPAGWSAATPLTMTLTLPLPLTLPLALALTQTLP